MELEGLRYLIDHSPHWEVILVLEVVGKQVQRTPVSTSQTIIKTKELDLGALPRMISLDPLCRSWQLILEKRKESRILPHKEGISTLNVSANLRYGLASWSDASFSSKQIPLSQITWNIKASLTTLHNFCIWSIKRQIGKEDEKRYDPIELRLCHP